MAWGPVGTQKLVVFWLFVLYILKVNNELHGA